MTVYFSADHRPYDFILWNSIDLMKKCCISVFVENWILYKMVKQHLDITNSTPYKNCGSNLLEKKISISYWLSALYKISCSIYIYFFKYLYWNVVWNIKSNKFNIIVCDLLQVSVGELTIINHIRVQVSTCIICILRSLLCMTVLCCFVIAWHSVAQFTKHLNCIINFILYDR